jgi:hypothetical protein
MQRWIRRDGGTYDSNMKDDTSNALTRLLHIAASEPNNCRLASSIRGFMEEIIKV